MKKVKAPRKPKAIVKSRASHAASVEKNLLSEADSCSVDPRFQKSDFRFAERDMPVLPTCFECSQKERNCADEERVLAENIRLQENNVFLEKNIDERFRELAALILILDATEKTCQEQAEQIQSLKADAERFKELMPSLAQEQEKSKNLTAELSCRVPFDRKRV